MTFVFGVNLDEKTMTDKHGQEYTLREYVKVAGASHWTDDPNGLLRRNDHVRRCARVFIGRDDDSASVLERLNDELKAERDEVKRRNRRRPS